MNDSVISIAILGISGRMGQALVSAIDAANDLRLSGAMDSPDSRWINQDAGALAGSSAAGVFVTDSPAIAIHDAQVAVNFTLPQATPAIVSACVAAGRALVIGTTGHSAEQLAIIKQSSAKIAIMLAPNMSLGVNLLLKLTELASKSLNEDYDIEVFEAHHRNKKDAPSGTLLNLVKTMQENGFSRSIDVGSNRAGRHPGTHEIGFDSAADTITLGRAPLALCPMNSTSTDKLNSRREQSFFALRTPANLRRSFRYVQAIP